MSEVKLPKGWESVTLDEISKFVIGGDWGKDPDKFWGEDFVEVACIRGSEIKNWGKEKGKTASIRLIKESSLEKRELILGDLLIEISGGGPDQPVGRVVRIDEEALSHNPSLPKVGTNFLRLLRLVDEVDNSYVNYYLQYFYHSGEVVKYQGGSNNLRNLKYKEYSKINIPLAPLPEQQRIVATLDAVFGHLDRVREKLDMIPDLLKNFRQQVLIKAMTGELTGELELADHFILESVITIGNEIKIKPKKWNWRLLTELARLESGHTPRKSREDYWEKGNVPWISLQDIRSAHGKVINETRYMPNQKGIENSSARLLPAGTVCFSRDISVGYVTIMGKEMATSQHFANWICGENLNNKFLLYAFMASRDYLVGEGKGTTVGTIYMPALKQMRLLIPPLDIQMKIVNQLDKFFLLADKIESQYQSLKSKIDQMPQAILAKAFRGELVEQEVKEYVREVEELGMVAEDLEKNHR